MPRTTSETSASRQKFKSGIGDTRGIAKNHFAQILKRAYTVIAIIHIESLFSDNLKSFPSFIFNKRRPMRARKTTMIIINPNEPRVSAGVANALTRIKEKIITNEDNASLVHPDLIIFPLKIFDLNNFPEACAEFRNVSYFLEGLDFLNVKNTITKITNERIISFQIFGFDDMRGIRIIHPIHIYKRAITAILRINTGNVFSENLKLLSPPFIFTKKNVIAKSSIEQIPNHQLIPILSIIRFEIEVKARTYTRKITNTTEKITLNIFDCSIFMFTLIFFPLNNFPEACAESRTQDLNIFVQIFLLTNVAL